MIGEYDVNRYHEAGAKMGLTVAGTTEPDYVLRDVAVLLGTQLPLLS